MRDPGENRSVLSVYSPWSVRRMVWDFLLPLGKGVWRAVGFRKMNRDMGEGRVLRALHVACGFYGCCLQSFYTCGIPVPHEAPVSCFTYDMLLQRS